jgi:hypothetical protein
MLNTISNSIYKVTNRYTVFLITAVFCLYVFWILPNSRDVDRIVGTGAALIVPFFEYLLYTPQDFYSQLEVYGPDGRASFADYRIIQATLWLLTLGAFLALSTSALLRVFTAADSGQRKLNLIAPLPSIFDFLENQLQIILVSFYPDRYDGLALLAAGFTAIKWITLLAAFIILFYALIKAAFARR